MSLIFWCHLESINEKWHDQADADDAYNFWLFWMKVLVMQKVELMVIIFMEPRVFHLLHSYMLLMLVSILNGTSFFLPLKLFLEFFVFQTVLFLTFRQNVVCCPPFLIIVQLLLLFGTQWLCQCRIVFKLWWWWTRSSYFSQIKGLILLLLLLHLASLFSCQSLRPFDFRLSLLKWCDLFWCSLIFECWIFDVRGCLLSFEKSWWWDVLSFHDLASKFVFAL